MKTININNNRLLVAIKVCMVLELESGRLLRSHNLDDLLLVILELALLVLLIHTVKMVKSWLLRSSAKISWIREMQNNQR